MSTTIEILTAAISARKDSLKALRGRIQTLLEPIPVGVKLSDETECPNCAGKTLTDLIGTPIGCGACHGTGKVGGPVCEIIRVCTGASQWSNRTWEVTIEGWAAVLPDSRLLCEDLDGSYNDGRNLHTRSTEPTCRYAGARYDGDAGDSLSWASGKVTRAVAVRLPRAIERCMEQCAAEKTANDATLA